MQQQQQQQHDSPAYQPFDKEYVHNSGDHSHDMYDKQMR